MSNYLTERNNKLWYELDGEEPIEIRAQFEVCDNCHGTGTHVNPSIDGNGLTAEDFAEDPDFREDYFSGVYDVQCERCHGKRVVLVPLEDEKQSAEALAALEDVREMSREDAFERRMRSMGCEW